MVWGVLGRAADQVTGIGVMLPSEGLYDLASPTPASCAGSPSATGTDSPPGRPSCLALADGSVKEVRTAIDGTIVALLVKLGSFVDAGSPVATIEPAGSDLQVVLYVGAADGKQIRPGHDRVHRAEHHPVVAVRHDEGHGHRGLEPDRQRRTARRHPRPEQPTDPALLERGPALEVMVPLERADTPSGFAWTASNGPDFPITSGTLVDGSVVIDEGSPVQQILGR